MNNQFENAITIETNDLRSLLIDIKYQVELSKDLAENIGKDSSSSGSVGYAAGQIYSNLDKAYDSLYEILDEHVPYIEEENNEDDENF